MPKQPQTDRAGAPSLSRHLPVFPGRLSASASAVESQQLSPNDSRSLSLSPSGDQCSAGLGVGIVGPALPRAGPALLQDHLQLASGSTNEPGGADWDCENLCLPERQPHRDLY